MTDLHRIERRRLLPLVLWIFAVGLAGMTLAIRSVVGQHQLASDPYGRLCDALIVHDLHHAVSGADVVGPVPRR